MKGGSTTAQTISLMQLLGGITFVVAIIYGLYVSTRDPDVWSNEEWIATIRVFFLFLTAMIFYQIAASLTGRGGRIGKGGKDDCPPGHGGGGHGGHRGYSGANVQSFGADDLTDTN